MKVKEEKFVTFEESINQTIAYLNDCKKACEELRTYNQLSEIPDDFLSLSRELSDAAIKRTCIAILGKEPTSISKPVPVSRHKVCTLL